jgi:hypothetical protein
MEAFLSEIKEKPALLLAVKILEVIRDAGVNQVDALCAIQASEAMLPALNLGPKEFVFSGGVDDL